MPITPMFSLRQDDTFIVAEIHLPWVRVGASELVVSGEEGGEAPVATPPAELDTTTALITEVKGGGDVVGELPTEPRDDSLHCSPLGSSLPTVSSPLPPPPSPLIARQLSSSGCVEEEEEEEEEPTQQPLPLAEHQGRGPKVSFFCKPYLLRLNLPASVIDDDRCRCEYDPDIDNGTMTLYLPKCVAGQWFDGLDMITRLMQTGSGSSRVATATTAVAGGVDSRGGVVPDRSARPLIEVVSSSEAAASSGAVDEEEEKESADAAAAAMRELQISAPSYGFNNQFTGFFKDLREDFAGMVEIPDPDGILAADRTRMRTAHEAGMFDPERYAVDMLHAHSDAIYTESVAFLPFWERQWQRKKEGGAGAGEAEGGGDDDDDDDGFDGFTADERHAMAQLPNKEYLIDEDGDRTRELLCGLADLLYAFCYDQRLTQGDPNTESGWTISILSPTLSWLEAYTVVSADEGGHHRHEPEYCVATACLRRCLIYPFIREWTLAVMVLRDVCRLLALGRRAILRALLSVHATMERSEGRYLLNRLFVADYAVWAQSLRPSTFASFAARFCRVCEPFIAAEVHSDGHLTLGNSDDAKTAVDLDLLQLEAFTRNWVNGEDDDGEEEEESSSEDDSSSSDDDGDDEDDGETAEAETETTPAARPLIEEIA